MYLQYESNSSKRHILTRASNTLAACVSTAPPLPGPARMQGVAHLWGEALVWCREDNMKATAFVGVFKAVAVAPQHS